jgi:hypothetical protein
MRLPSTRLAFAVAVSAIALGADAHAFQDMTRVSVDSSGVQGDGDSLDNGISADGRFVAFWSNATNLVSGDTNNAADVFVFDLATSTVERVSVDSAGNENSWGASSDSARLLSGDGSRVAFTTLGAFDPIDTNWDFDIYVRDRGSGTTILASVDSSGGLGDGSSDRGALSHDGVVVAFDSFATNFAPNDANGVYDVFVHDLASGVTERVSVDSSGGEGDDWSFQHRRAATGASSPSRAPRRTSFPATRTSARTSSSATASPGRPSG